MTFEVPVGGGVSAIPALMLKVEELRQVAAFNERASSNMPEGPFKADRPLIRRRRRRAHAATYRRPDAPLRLCGPGDAGAGCFRMVGSDEGD
ncbi:hypothetical protein KCP70_02785 [Salmonella enterica subsp. enterica]|nr:hypothetical protein KCP70_02785 [Salmonella enterica subsp. enterica]